MLMNWMMSMTAVQPEVAEVAQQTGLSALPLMTQGWLTTGLGLVGVFLVLALFFVTIKLMQRIRTKDSK